MFPSSGFGSGGGFGAQQQQPSGFGSTGNAFGSAGKHIHPLIVIVLPHLPTVVPRR